MDCLTHNNTALPHDSFDMALPQHLKAQSNNLFCRLDMPLPSMRWPASYAGLAG